MTKAEAKTKHKGESRSRYRLCFPPCPHYITSGDTHSLCVVCLGAKHAESALEEADCPHCERLPLHTFCSPKALFEEGAFTSVLRGACPAFSKAERRLRSWESQMDQVEGMKMGGPLSSSSPIRSGAHPAVSSPRREGSTLRLSSSEEVDVEDAD